MIVSRANRKVKTIRRLRKCKGDHVLLEGPHLVGEALTAALELEIALATPAFLDSAEGRDLLSRMPQAPEPIDPGILASLTDADSPRGILALARLSRQGVERLVPAPGGPVLYLEGLQDPGNLGALARTAEAFGAGALALSPGTVHPNHPRALRGSAGSLLRIPLAVDAEPASLSRRLPGSTRWLALSPHRGDDPRTADLEGPLVLALGGEGPGLSRELGKRADLWLRIPVAAPVESLNVTVAAAIALWEIARRAAADV